LLEHETSLVPKELMTDSVLKGEMRPLRNPAGAHEVEDLIDDET